MTLELARVVAVHHDRQTVEVVYLNSGARATEVRVMGDGSSDSGSWSVPDVPRPSSERQAGRISGPGRTLTAVMGTLHGRPIVLGFLASQNSQMMQGEPNRFIRRFPGGAYVTVGPDGTIDVARGGATIRIGTGASAPPPAGPNGSPAPQSGVADITVTVGGVTFAIKNGGTIEATCTEFKIDGKLTVTGDIETTGGDVKKPGDITLGTHKHTGVTAGAAKTGGPST